MTRFARHLIVALLAGTTLNARSAQTPQPGSASFDISVRGQRTGSETVTLSKTDTGWLISVTGSQLGQVPVTIDKFEARYSADWRPQSLVVDALMGTVFTLSTTFTGTTATNDITQGGQKSAVTHTVSPKAIVLPNNIFGAYEALAAQLATSAVGMQLPIYVAPQAEVSATVMTITPQRLQTPDALVDLRHFGLLVKNPSGQVAVDVSVDGKGRMARVGVPSAGILALRSDLSNVMTRDASYTNDADAPVFIKGLGFTMAATMTTPPASVMPAEAAKRPAIILVSGTGGRDRDETVSGIPVFGQLSAALARAGFVVLRYDKRGVGQSGGRPESMTLQDHADDVMSLVSWLRDRKDIDRDRIAVVGLAEGAAIAMLAGDRAGSKIAALALVNGPGMKGRDIVLAQQQHALAQTADPPDARKAKIDLQTKILDAVVSGTGWEGVPPAMQRAADTPIFKSWIEFDPAKTMKKVDQPILIMHGALDTEIAPANAEALAALARGRKAKTASQTRTVLLPGVNHLLVPARTGDVAEYATLAGGTISPDVAAAISDWLRTVMTARK